MSADVKIYIDFLAGSHGNYLEFVCNKFLSKILCNEDPFNSLGSSHNKYYLAPKKFIGSHYSNARRKIPELKNSKIISICISNDDLLPLSSISLLRAGDYNIDNDLLEINTYHKLNNFDYRPVLDNLLDSFFNGFVRQSYNAVRDASWPDVDSIDSFKKLPQWIQDECLTTHNLSLFELTKESPDCPRSILREFFKIGFKSPNQAGFIIGRERMVYHPSNDVYFFPFNSFYNTELFLWELNGIDKWLNLYGYNPSSAEEVTELHNKFLKRQPYINSKNFCDSLLVKIKNKENFDFPKLDLLQESYLTAQIELSYDVELPNNNIWFTHGQEILNYINEII